MARTVLVVEYEMKLRELLRNYLEREGYSVVTTGSGAEALALLETVGPDLVVLDLGLPDIAGETVAAELRRSSNIPVLVLTAKTSEADRIRSLEIGVDDYVTKPFSPREVILRINAILRRSSGVAATAAQAFGDGELLIDESRHEVVVRDTPVDLTATEFGILSALASTPGRVYSRTELLNRVRGYEFASERAVDSHVKNLRRKLEIDPGAPHIVSTVIGAGYRLGLNRDR